MGANSESTAQTAWVPGRRLRWGPEAPGPLSGHRFAVKDLFDVAGASTTAGNPDWARTHPAARSTAPVVGRLLRSGAALVGKTICDELAFSLEGENLHYGTPLNPRAPGCLPGGSSSGSASAVARGWVDFALGTDTGGSVRVPASYCGIFGFRPTHGRISMRGVVPLAPEYDTVGWFARDAATMARVGSTLFGSSEARLVGSIGVARDAFDLLPEAEHRLLTSIVEQRFPQRRSLKVFPEGRRRWLDAYRFRQGRSAWALHGPWIQRVHPRFAPEIAERFAYASRVTRKEAEWADRTASTLARSVHRLLGEDRILLVPAAPTAALPRTAPPQVRGRLHRELALPLGAIAGHSGCPELVVPVGECGGRPVGLGLVAPRGWDVSLLRWAEERFGHRGSGRPAGTSWEGSRGLWSPPGRERVRAEPQSSGRARRPRHRREATTSSTR
ncbi:MAG: amidase [Thermoplasmata archaeon]